MFDKKKEGDGTKVVDNDSKDELQKKAKDFHPVARRFEKETKGTLYQEWSIFETRYRAALNLKEDASMAEVKRAIARVKRASMDVRDALKELGQFKI